jgi:hypothetical protein
MLQRGAAGRTALAVGARFRQKEGKETRRGAWRYLRGGSALLVVLATAGLARAGDHGIDRVKNDGKQHPEDRGEEKTAHDLAYGMGLEEAG